MKNLLEVLFGPNRIQKVKILLLLKDKPTYISQIARELKIDQPTVTGHIHTLEEVGLVTHEKIGPLKMYQLTDFAKNEIIPCIERLMKTHLKERKK